MRPASLPSPRFTLPGPVLRGLRAALLILATGVALSGYGAKPPEDTVRVGVLEYGTVNWELAVVQAHDLGKQRGVALEVVPLASENALAVALQGGRVDVIVSDWLWVAHQRAAGRRYQFAPYSLAVGAVMVNPGAGIGTVEDLAGGKLGIAGGPVDKTWLLLRAYAAKKHGVDLEAMVEPTFAAPPIINKLMMDQSLPAAINFWHYNARLLASGREPLITVETMLAELGVATPPPLLGWVFHQDWADQNSAALKAFLDAGYAAKARLAGSDAEWQDIRHLVQPETEAVFAAIIAGYRAGIPQAYGQPQIEAARQLFRILAATGGGALVGDADSLPPEVFWDGFHLP